MDISKHPIGSSSRRLEEPVPVIDQRPVALVVSEKVRADSVAPSFPKSPFYFFFCCFHKRIFIEEPYYEYYTQIFDYVYTTDGRLYLGYYKHCPLTNTKILEYDNLDPDHKYCFPCWIINYLWYI
jgi:hypothetical protein